MKRVPATLAMVLLLPLAAAGHAGHDHGAGPAPAAPAVVARGHRAALRVPPVELVLVREADGGLSIHADDDASNAPLEAELGVQLGRRRVQAAAVSPGSWHLPAAVVDAADGSPLRCEFRRAGQVHGAELPLPPRPGH